jgi:phosphatidylserine/phosphatidylglycerophosphate/cardiolipin synthase-like enzyme
MNRTQAADLPENVYGDTAPNAGGQQQMWHDQHLMLEGPIVATIEDQFRERWVDHATGLYQLGLLGNANFSSGQVIFTTANAYAGGQVLPLPVAPPVPAPLVPPLAGPGSQVQMWRTIPLRAARPAQQPTFLKRGEFTVMAGIANAVWQAQELIWMFDQYFWSVPLARLLNAALLRRQALRLILILPPYADGDKPGRSHVLRNTALRALVTGLPRTNNVLDQVGIYNMWYGQSLPPNSVAKRGIYVHAKGHTYDNSLLVCGSANMNRRSFLCDTELACAVEDPAVVTAHQQLLWAQLFPGGNAWPALNLNNANQGAAFFTAFQAAVANVANSLLIQDPWDQPTPRLPNLEVRPVNDEMPAAPIYAEVEPTSVNDAVETQAAHGALDEIVTLLENTPGQWATWPWRRP